MKSVISALLILTIIIGGSMIFTNNLNDISKKFLSKNNELYDSITENEFDKASKILSELDDDVKKNRLLLASIIDHSEIDKIELNIAQAKAYINEGKKEDSLSYVSALSSMFSHIPKNYQIKIENIL